MARKHNQRDAADRELAAIPGFARSLALDPQA